MVGLRLAVIRPTGRCWSFARKLMPADSPLEVGPAAVVGNRQTVVVVPGVRVPHDRQPRPTFSLFAVVLISAGFHTTRNAHLLLRAFLNNVCEVFRVPTKHGDRIPRCSSVLPLLRLLIEPTMRLSSTKREARLTVLRELQTANLTNICSKTYLRQLLVLLNLCCTIPANTDPWFFLLILRYHCCCDHDRPK